MTRRLAIAFFYDRQGIFDDYMPVLLEGVRPFVERIVLVCNGALTPDSEAKARASCDTLIIRENKGFDVWGYKAGIESVGYDALADYDEVLFFNHTFFGPIFPFSEMFDAMAARNCDFWGISAHKAVAVNPFTLWGELPYHLNSHFIAVRKRMLASAEFGRYWNGIGPIDSYEASVLRHETRFTGHFTALGYKVDTYLDTDRYGSPYPVFFDVDETIRDRSPILKRRLFFEDSRLAAQQAIDLQRALVLIRENSDYDESLIWTNIIRSAELRTLNVNAALTSVFPDIRLLPASAPQYYGSIAVCAHVYYVDMLGELLASATGIPGRYDFIATTDTPAKKAEIERVCAADPHIARTIVRVVEQNRGRDMSALFITCRDLFLDDRYDLVCRLHTKRTPQIEPARASHFKRHLMDNLMGSGDYVTNILDMFSARPWIGLAIPPVVHISFITIGNAWLVNRPRAEKVAADLALDVPFDPHTPVAAYGTMFWFRPRALRKLFAHEWRWEDFNQEPDHKDGGLAHVLERLIAYVAQDAGFTTEHVMSTRSAAQNYTMLEYKLEQRIIGGGFGVYSVKRSLRDLLYSVANSLNVRAPRTYGVLRGAYRHTRKAVDRLRR